MAESLDSDAESVDISSDLLKCNICYGRFQRPRTLPCLHSFCQTCLQRHVDSSVVTRNGDAFGMFRGASSEFACPTCREEVTLPALGVLGFRHDFRVEQMQDFVQKSLRWKSAASKPKTISSACRFCGRHAKEDHVTVTSYCCDCLKEICQGCADKHRRLRIFAEHRIIRLSSTNNNGDPEKPSSCPQHPQEALGYLCGTCNEAVCAICVMGVIHEEHSISPLAEGLQKYQEAMEAQGRILDSRVKQLRALESGLVSRQQNIEDLHLDVAGQVKRRVDALVADLRQQESQLLEELDERCAEELFRIKRVQAKLDEAMCGLTSVRDFVESLLEQQTDVTMVPVYKEVMEKTTNYVEDSPHYDSDFGLEFAASPRKVHLGRLLNPSKKTPHSDVVSNGARGRYQSGGRPEVASVQRQSPRSRRRAKIISSQLKSQRPLPAVRKGISKLSNNLQKYSKKTPCVSTAVRLVAKFGRFGSSGGEFSSPRDICFLDKGKLLVVADTNNERLQVFDSNGLLTRVIDQGRVKPWGVTATPAGNIAVTDNLEKCVKVYDKLGNLIHKFGKFLCPCGIAVTSSGDFIVTDFFSTFVYVLSRQGIPVSQFELRTKTDQHLCGSSRVAVDHHGNIIVSDVSNGVVKLFDKRGKVLRVVSDPAHLLSPQGVAVDCNGRILVADAMKQHIVAVDAQGRHLATVLQNTGRDLRDPTGLAVCATNLVVTQTKINQVKVYTLD